MQVLAVAIILGTSSRALAATDVVGCGCYLQFTHMLWCEEIGSVKHDGSRVRSAVQHVCECKRWRVRGSTIVCRNMQALANFTSVHVPKGRNCLEGACCPCRDRAGRPVVAVLGANGRTGSLVVEAHLKCVVQIVFKSVCFQQS